MQQNSFSEENRVCSVCKGTKDVKLFYTSNRAKSGYRSECKDCHGKNVKEYYKNNLERCRAYARDYYSKNKESIREKAKAAYHQMKKENEKRQ